MVSVQIIWWTNEDEFLVRNSIAQEMNLKVRATFRDICGPYWTDETPTIAWQPSNISFPFDDTEFLPGRWCDFLDKTGR